MPTGLDRDGFVPRSYTRLPMSLGIAVWVASIRQVSLGLMPIVATGVEGCMLLRHSIYGVGQFICHRMP